MCSWVWSLAGVVHRGVASPEDAVPILTLACLAGSVFAGSRVVSLRSGLWTYSGVVGAWWRWPPYGLLVCHPACCVVAGICAVVWVVRGCGSWDVCGW